MITGSYDFDAAFVEVDAAYTNKPPGASPTAARSG